MTINDNFFNNLTIYAIYSYAHKKHHHETRNSTRFNWQFSIINFMLLAGLAWLGREGGGAK